MDALRSGLIGFYVQELDKKKKKKKGTLGVGNGAVFFASETDKVRTVSKCTVLITHSLAFEHSCRLPCNNTLCPSSPTSPTKNQNIYT